MKLLLVNDDGIFAPGIAALVKAFAKAGYEVLVCAPDSQRSAASHSLTILSLALEDAGQVTAEAEGIQSTAALRVRGELVGRQGGRHSFLYQVLLVSCTDTPCCRPGSSPLG